MKKNQKGFSVIEFVIVLLVVGVIGFVGVKVLGSKDKMTDSNQGASNQEPDAEADIELQNFGLESLDSVDITSQALRDYKSQGLKGFYVFGDKLSGGRSNPNFEFASLKQGIKVVAAIDGIVGFVKQQPDTGDYEVFLQPKENSAWTIGYDHLTNVNVKQGDTVKVGDVLGEPAMQNNGLTRFEIQINKDEDGSTTYHCPSTLLAASAKDKLLADLVAMQQNWEANSGLELYDIVAQDPAGCIKKTMNPQEAEG